MHVGPKMGKCHQLRVSKYGHLIVKLWEMVLPEPCSPHPMPLCVLTSSDYIWGSFPFLTSFGAFLCDIPSGSPWAPALCPRLFSDCSHLRSIDWGLAAVSQVIVGWHSRDLRDGLTGSVTPTVSRHHLGSIGRSSDPPSLWGNSGSSQLTPPWGHRLCFDGTDLIHIVFPKE